MAGLFVHKVEGVVLRDWFSCVVFQAEDGIRDLVRSRGLGDVYKRQVAARAPQRAMPGDLSR